MLPVDDDELPTYDQLPVHPVLGLPHAWGVLDPDVGSLALATPAAVAAAAALVTEGEQIPLNVSLGLISPPLFGRAALRHSVHADDRNTFEDVLDSFNPQAGSQWDGFRHVRAREFGFFGGVEDIAPEDTETLSIEHIARRGVAARGVLLDVAAWFAHTGQHWDPFAGDLVEAQVLADVAVHQGVQLRRGDIVCVRLGWVAAYRALEPSERSDERLSRRFSGLRSNADTAQFLWDHHVAAVCTDNPAIESAPGNREDGSLHRRLLPLLGIVMGELFDLERLAARCTTLGRYEFLFMAAPLPVPGGLSSPANAMALL